MTVKKDTIIRTVILIVALANQILTSTGHSVIPVNDEELAELISLLITIGASIWAWWKNNSFTPNAIKADTYKRELSDGEGVTNE